MISNALLEKVLAEHTQVMQRMSVNAFATETNVLLTVVSELQEIFRRFDTVLDAMGDLTQALKYRFEDPVYAEQIFRQMVDVTYVAINDSIRALNSRGVEIETKGTTE